MADNEQFKDLDKAMHGKLIDFMQNKFHSLEIAGKNVIQTLDGEFIDYILIEEEYFVTNWLTQFAIGHVGQKNYFDHTSWSRLTDGFTKGAIILNSQKQPVCIIRKFIDMDLTMQQQYYMTESARKASQAKFIPNSQEADQLINEFSSAVDIIAGQNPDYDTLTAMIPLEYYLYHRVDPTVVKQVIYIRDNYVVDGQPLDPESELMTQVEEILYKYARGEKTTQAEQKVVTDLTNGDFVFDDDTNKVDTQTSEAPTEDKPFDPLAD